MKAKKNHQSHNPLIHVTLLSTPLLFFSNVTERQIKEERKKE